MRTLRFYDQIGLFTSSGHTQSGHRLYDESDLSRLQQIVSLKEMGLSLEEVKSVLNTAEPDTAEGQKCYIRMGADVYSLHVPNPGYDRAA